MNRFVAVEPHHGRRRIAGRYLGQGRKRRQVVGPIIGEKRFDDSPFAAVDRAHGAIEPKTGARAGVAQRGVERVARAGEPGDRLATFGALPKGRAITASDQALPSTEIRP